MCLVPSRRLITRLASSSALTQSDPFRYSLDTISYHLQIGSVLAVPEYLNHTDGNRPKPYVVEGIGYDFVPDVLSRDPADIDHWIKTSDQDAFHAVQRLMRTEGLLVGGSSGSVLHGALAWLKTDQGKTIAQTEGHNVVVLLPDGYVNSLFRLLEATSTPSSL